MARALIVNGTTIPETLGKIVVGGTSIKQVDVVTGGTSTTVWKVEEAPPTKNITVYVHGEIGNYSWPSACVVTTTIDGASSSYTMAGGSTDGSFTRTIAQTGTVSCTFSISLADVPKGLQSDRFYVYRNGSTAIVDEIGSVAYISSSTASFTASVDLSTISSLKITVDVDFPTHTESEEPEEDPTAPTEPSPNTPPEEP